MNNPVLDLFPAKAPDSHAFPLTELDTLTQSYLE